MTRPLRWFAMLSVALLVVAACGDDGGEDGGEQTDGTEDAMVEEVGEGEGELNIIA